MTITYPLPEGYFSGGSHVPDGTLEDIVNDLGAKTAYSPSEDEKDAMAGTSGTPSASNPFVTDADGRLPTTDEKAAMAGTAGSPSATNEFVTDSDGRLPTNDEKDALAGTSGSPSATNAYVTDADLRLLSWERAGAPELDRLDVSEGAWAAAGGDITLIGRALLQGQTFDTITKTEGAASVAIHALKPGDSGITCQIIAGAGALGVAFTPGTGALVITLAAGGSSDDAVATAINADASQCNGYLRAVSASGGNFTLAASSAPLTGGTGDYAKNKIMAGGLEALPANETGITATAKWSNTSIECTTQAVGSAGDIATVAVQSDGVFTQSLSAVLA